MDTWHSLTPADIESLKKTHAVTFETVEKSHVRDIYWTGSWTETIPGIDVEREATPDLDTEFVILRPLGDSRYAVSETPEDLLEQTLFAPLNRVRFYDGTSPLSLEGRPSVIERSRKRVKSKLALQNVVQRVAYAFPPLGLVQIDYLDQLFQSIWENIFDEQENNIRSRINVIGESESKKNTLNLMPTNSTIGRFVTEMSLEKHADVYYLAFTYEEPLSSRMKIQEPLPEIPESLDMTATIPLDDDDEWEDEDERYMTMDEQGDTCVLFDIILTRVNRRKISDACAEP